MLKKDLQEWFGSHPAISPRKLAADAGLNIHSRFQRYIRMPAKDDETVPDRYMEKIIPTLRKYDGWGELVYLENNVNHVS